MNHNKILFESALHADDFWGNFHRLGRTAEGGKESKVLQEVQVPVISNQQCRQNYADIMRVSSEKQFNEGVICAGLKEG